MEYDTNTMARAKMTNVVVSVKDSREVSAALRGKSIAAGLALLADVKEKKRAIRYTRYNQESAGHRRNVSGPGRYPLKAAMAFTDLLASVRSNAEFKDLDPELLRIVHIKADMAPTPARYGRHRGRQGKRAHIEIIVKEDERLKKTKKTDAQSVTATKQKAVSKKAPASKPKKESAKNDSAVAPKADTAPSKKADTPQNIEASQKADEKTEPKKSAPKPASEKPASEKDAVKNEAADAPEQKPKARKEGETQ